MDENYQLNEIKELEQTHKMRFYPDPVLRRESKPVTVFGEVLKKFTVDLAGAMLQQRGVGISAPQVGVFQRVIIINLTGKNEDNIVLINPVIKNESEERWKAPEGCLSFPKVSVIVDRPKNIIVEADSFEGEKVTLELKGWGARVVMHEIDHLDGVLLIDHASNVKKDIIKRKMAKFNRKVKRDKRDAA